MSVNRDNEQSVFLEKVAHKLGRATPQGSLGRGAVGAPDFWTSYSPTREELLNQFVVNAEQLTIRSSVIKDLALLQAQLRFWLTELKAKSVMCWDTEQMRSTDIADTCGAAGVEVKLWDYSADRNSMIRECASVDVGITWADYAIANTGTLAIMSSPEQSRPISLLPPVHIAIINRDRIVAHMGDVFKALNPRELPSALNFITGPSRTSDIEMDLTLGVHGPGKVYVLILDQVVEIH